MINHPWPPGIKINQHDTLQMKNYPLSLPYRAFFMAPKKCKLENSQKRKNFMVANTITAHVSMIR